jgi:hypothetical protein
MRKEAFFCSCGLNEHLVVLSSSTELDDDYTYLSVHLPQTHFLDRLISGTKYIFGISDHIEFSELCLDGEAVDRMINFLKNRDVPS